jgi:hypothetical protein
MKKLVVFLILFCFIVAGWCFADEGLKTSEDNQTSLVHNNLSLPLLGFNVDFSNQTHSDSYSATNFALNKSTLEWGQTDFGLTKYASGGLTGAGAAALGLVCGFAVIGLIFLIAFAGG